MESCDHASAMALTDANHDWWCALCGAIRNVNGKWNLPFRVLHAARDAGGR